MKHCPKCDRDLDLELFGLNRRTKSGINSWCKECCRRNTARYRSTEEGAQKHREREKSRYLVNPDAIKKRAKEWHHANREKAKLTAKKNYLIRKLSPDFKEKENFRQRKWYQRNPAKGIARTRNRQSIQMRAMPSWLSFIERAQIQEFYDICIAVTKQTGIKHHVDHIIPLKGKRVNGLHVPWNLQVITASENCSMGNKGL